MLRHDESPFVWVGLLGRQILAYFSAVAQVGCCNKARSEGMSPSLPGRRNQRVAQKPNACVPLGWTVLLYDFPHTVSAVPDCV